MKKEERAKKGGRRTLHNHHTSLDKTRGEKKERPAEKKSENSLVSYTS